jgi:hypothetical protein
MYSDRMGLFGKGWLRLLGTLGLSEPDALNALVAVARVLQGKEGTVAIWKAFTAVIDTPERGVAGEVDSQAQYANAFSSWATALRQQLRHDGVDDDEPYRVLVGAGATGMTAMDMANFACLVQDWIDATDLGDSEITANVGTWAGDLTEAIEMAGATVAMDRRARGRSKVAARDRARADTKAKALDRRTSLLATGAPTCTTRDKEALRRSIAKLAPRRTIMAHKAKARQARCTAGAQAARQGQKKPPRATAKPTQLTAGEASEQGAAAEAAWQLESRALRAERRATDSQHMGTGRLAHKGASARDAAKRRAPAPKQTGDEIHSKRSRTRTDAGLDGVGQKRRARGNDGLHEAGEIRAQGKTRQLTGSKRSEEHRDDDGAESSKARRTRTRERLSIGTTNLEPD